MPNPTESVIQQYIMRMIKKHPMFGKNFTVFATPNQGFKGGQRYGAKMKSEGAQAGVPDLTVLFGDGRVFWIEMKRKGKYLDKNQRAFHSFLERLGHKIVTITACDCNDGWSQFGNQLEEWGVI